MLALINEYWDILYRIFMFSIKYLNFEGETILPDSMLIFFYTQYGVEMDSEAQEKLTVIETFWLNDQNLELGQNVYLTMKKYRVEEENNLYWKIIDVK